MFPFLPSTFRANPLTDHPASAPATTRPSATEHSTAGGPPPGVRPHAALPEPSVVPEHGWHVGHYFYRFRRDQLDAPLSENLCQQFCAALAPGEDHLPERLAAYWVSGHEADFGIVVMDPHPGKAEGIHQALLAPGIGRWIEPAWSFISVSEVSEYVPTAEAYRQRRDAGDDLLAQTTYEAAASYPDAPPETWRALGESYRKLGRTEDAISAYRSYLTKAPDASDAALVAQAINTLETE